jgi:hypothetical protein
MLIGAFLSLSLEDTTGNLYIVYYRLVSCVLEIMPSF